MNLLTSSRLHTFRECARKHRYRYQLGYVPVTEGAALRFGHLIHIGLEAWWKAEDGARQDAALKAITKKGAADPYDFQRAAALLVGYTERWEQDCELYQVMYVEKKFKAPLLNPSTWRESRTWELGGKIDLLLRERASGRVLVTEHKTTSDPISSDADRYWQKLAMDPQLSEYVLGAEALGYQADECLYDVLKKSNLRPLQKNTRRDAPESPEEFGGRILAEIREDPNAAFQRKRVPRIASQLEEFLFDAWQIGGQIRESELTNVAPRNPDSCFPIGRGPCPYWEVCSNGLSLEESGYFKRIPDVNPELADAS